MRQSPLLPNGSITDEVRHALALVRRGCDELLVEDEFAQKLAHSAETGAPLRIKLGLDPTAPDIHLGHTVALNKMRQLQALGHRVIFLIGDFTALIGDPSGRNAMRPPLSREQIRANAQTYFAQATRILDPGKTEIRYNSEWGATLGAEGLIQLASHYTIARMLEREDFKRRYQANAPLALHEFCIRCCKAMTRWHCRPISNSAEQIKNSICWSAGNCKNTMVRHRSAY